MIDLAIHLDQLVINVSSTLFSSYSVQYMLREATNKAVDPSQDQPLSSIVFATLAYLVTFATTRARTSSDFREERMETRRLTCETLRASGGGRSAGETGDYQS